MYNKVFSGTEECNLFDRHIDGARHIVPVDPAWECTFEVTGPDPTLSLSLQLWEEDNAVTGFDDHAKATGRMRTALGTAPTSIIGFQSLGDRQGKPPVAVATKVKRVSA